MVCAIIRSRSLPKQAHQNFRAWADLSQDLTTLPRPRIGKETRERLLRPLRQNGSEYKILSETTPNPSVKTGQYRSLPLSNGKEGSNGNGKTSSRRYYASADDGLEWPPELHDYNKRFAKALEGIKRRHDSVVTTVGRNDW